MHRTTILLPEKLRRAAEREAHSLGISLAELIRRRLAPAQREESQNEPAFFSRRPWAGPGATDLAANHDRYLYGE